VAVASVEPDRRELARRSWAAVGVGEISVASAGFLALMGVFIDFEFCVGGCPPDANAVGAGAIILFVTGVLFLVAGLFWTAYVSRGTARDALVYGSLANAAVAAALLLVWLPFGAGGFAPGFVLAIALAAAIALREPAPAARYLRIAGIVALTLTASVDDTLASVLVALLAFPAVGAADTIALQLEADAER
jgi:hypothetical protein